MPSFISHVRRRVDGRYNEVVISFELICPSCHWRTASGRDDAIARLRRIGLLRREPDPEDDYLSTLLIDAAQRMACPACHRPGLRAAKADATEDDGDWQAAVLCELCRQPIPPERIAALPGVKRCAVCQQQAEAGQAAADDAEFCPQCGALLDVRVSRGTGITRYKRVCTGMPPCRM